MTSREQVGGHHVFYKYKLPDSTALQIGKQGIYYYGTIFIRDNKISFTYEKPKGILKLAKEKYAEYFTKLSPTNFSLAEAE